MRYGRLVSDDTIIATGCFYGWHETQSAAGASLNNGAPAVFFPWGSWQVLQVILPLERGSVIGALAGNTSSLWSLVFAG